jgi:hypothetical protein
MIIQLNMPSLIEENLKECELNYENYLSFIKQREYTVVLFYTPYHKQYRKLSFQLNEVDISKDAPLCTINHHDNKEFKELFDLDPTPTFFIFYRSRKYRIRYNGSLTIENINKWIKDKTGNYVGRLTKYEEILNLATKVNNLTVVFLGDTKDYDREWRIFKAVGRKFDKNVIKFYYCERCKEFNIFDIIVFNNIDKVKSLFKNSLFKKNITYDNFYRFIDVNTKPLVRELSYEFTDDLFKHKLPGMILYYDSDQIKLSNDSDIYMLLRKVAHKNKVSLM